MQPPIPFREKSSAQTEQNVEFIQVKQPPIEQLMQEEVELLQIQVALGDPIIDGTKLVWQEHVLLVRTNPVRH
jgi:hypothetical protein